MQTFNFEKSIPLTPIRFPIEKKYDLDGMSAGDSFFVGKDLKKILGGVVACGKKQGWKMATRTVEGGYRVWRLE